MASQFPRSPKLLKGALISYASQFLGPVPNVIVFQYNPDTMSRTLSDRTPRPDPSDIGASREDTYRVQGPPVEMISLAVELDATDQLEQPLLNPWVVAYGLHPALASLELLLYPSDSQVLLNQSLLKPGQASVTVQKAPIVLFVWGVARVVPVQLINFSITEQAYDQLLNPIRANVDLSMQVLTYMELEDASIGRLAYTATQVQKEVLARFNLANSVESVGVPLPF
jgi:hypothetical protein